MVQLRCEAKLHGIILPNGIFEIKCDSLFCKKSRGVTVLHRFNVTTGELVETLRFKNPERSPNGTRDRRPAVRHP